MKRFENEPRFTFINHDVVAPLSIEGPLDEIYNLACPASPPQYQLHPVQTTKTCVMGAINMLDLAMAKSAKVLQASTSEVYGDPEVHPQPESYWGRVNPNGPRSCYDEGKRCAESLFFDYYWQYKVRIKIARIFNTYGPNMALDDGRVVSNFIIQALRNEPVVLFGDGAQTRSFCYVDDLVDGLIRLMETDDSVTGPVNLGNDGEFTVRQLAELTQELVGSEPRFEFRPLPKDDPRMRRPDLTLARALLGWGPTTQLRDGLARTIPYFRAALAANVSSTV
jgi:UDP-glucuronate decarboxylase